MKYAAWGLIAVGVLLAGYGGFSLWFARGDWMEVGLGAIGVIAALAGVVINRVADQTAGG